MHLLLIGDRADSVYPIENRMLLLGRAPENDIILDRASLPPVAARVFIREDDVVLEMVASCPIKHNGKRCKAAVLKYGDRFEIGDIVFIVHRSNASRGDSARDGSEVLGDITDFCEHIGRERSLHSLLNNLMQSLLSMMGATEAFIITLSPEGKADVFVSSTKSCAEERFSDTVVQRVLQTGESIAIPNALDSPDFSKSKSVSDLKLRSVICVPIRIATKVLGVVYLGSQTAAVSFSEHNLPLLTLYATIAGMLINHLEFISQQRLSIERLQKADANDGLIAESAPMRRVLADMQALAQADIPVLLEGETGVGKDVIANAIHKNSSRSTMPFVPVNCSSLKGELLESELFGHKRGSFTGAIRDHEGLFCAADGGVLFLDEIGELDIGLQAKLLRTLESGRIRPVGATSERVVNVRIICATNRNLREMVAQGFFRNDLYYRINQFRIEIPALRNRGDDILLLAYYFLELFKAKYPLKDIVDFHPDSLKKITSYPWPGNVRELASVVHKAVLSGDAPLISVDLPENQQAQSALFEPAVAAFQKQFLEKALRACGGNKEETARRVGLSRSTFFRYLSSLGVR